MDLMHRDFRVETLLRKILRLWLRMTYGGCGSCFITMPELGAWCVQIGRQDRFASARRGRAPALHCAFRFALPYIGGAVPVKYHNL